MPPEYGFFLSLLVSILTSPIKLAMGIPLERSDSAWLCVMAMYLFTTASPKLMPFVGLLLVVTLLRRPLWRLIRWCATIQVLLTFAFWDMWLSWKNKTWYQRARTVIRISCVAGLVVGSLHSNSCHPFVPMYHVLLVRVKIWRYRCRSRRRSQRRAKTSVKLVLVERNFDPTKGFPGEGPPKTTTGIKSFFQLQDPILVKQDQKQRHEAAIQKKKQKEDKAAEEAQLRTLQHERKLAGIAGTEDAEDVAAETSDTQALDADSEPTDAHTLDCDSADLEDDAQVAPAWNLKALGKKFDISWLRQRHNGYYCDVCSHSVGLRQGKQIWTQKPCVNKNADAAIRKHLASETHRAVTKCTTQTTVPEIKEKMRPEDILLIEKRLRTIYCLAKKNIALMHYRDLVELGELNGSYDTITTLDLEAYLSNDIARQMLSILASIVRRDTMAMVHSSNYVGVMIDESLDISVTEQMVITGLLDPTEKARRCLRQ